MSVAVKENPSLPLCNEILYDGIRSNVWMSGFWTVRPYSACRPINMFVKTVNPAEEKYCLDVGTIVPVVFFEEDDDVNALLRAWLLLDFGTYAGIIPTPSSWSVGVFEWSARYKALP